MVDKIDKTDPNLLRVQEAPKDRDRRQRGEEEGGGGGGDQGKEREKDEYEKEKTDWKKLIPKPHLAPSSTLGKKWSMRSASPSEGNAPSREREISEEKESSLSLSQRLFVLWGIIDFQGRPRIPVIVTYAVVATVAILSLGMIVGLLWR